MATINLIGYARDRTGAGIGSATVEAYALTDLNTNAKSASPVASTFPSGTTGRWVLTIDTTANPSPTGLYAVKLTNGTDIRWIEPDAVLSTQTLVGPFGAAPLAPASITDSLIGNRTVAPATVPSSNTGDLSTLLSGISHQILGMHGRTNWYDAPEISLHALNAHAGRHATGQPDAITPVSISAADRAHAHVQADLPASLDAHTLQGNLPTAFATANHTHASTGVGAHTHVGGDITSAVNDASHLGGVAAAQFAYIAGGQDTGPGGGTFPTGLKMEIGSATPNFTNGVSQTVGFATSLGAIKLLIALRGSDEGTYSGAVVPHTSTATGFTVATPGVGFNGQLRVNYIAFGT